MPRRCRPTFVLPGNNPGLRVKGNIDICNRPSVWNKQERGYSSVFSTSFGTDEGEVLVPRVLTNPPRIVSRTAAEAYYDRTGEHLGIFDGFRNANRYADRLHLQQQRIGRTG